MVLTLSSIVGVGTAINCYVCDSYNDLYCSEKWDLSSLGEDIQPDSCEGTFEAQYCIKSTGMYEGEIGTKRFCSSKHLGNYCDYNSRTGDVNDRGNKREYRACIYTCSGDGCNPASNTAAASATLVVLAVLYVLLIRRQVC